MESSRVTVCIFVGMLVTASSAAAEGGTSRAQATATVVTAAPVYLLPDTSRQPLRTLPVGTTLTIMQIRGEWLEVTFIDSQFGRRTGWVQRETVRVNAAPPPDEKPLKPAAPTPTPGGARPAAQPSRTPAPTALGIRGFATITFDKMAATESFKAITESDTVTFFGGGIQVTNLWRGLFAEVSVETTSLDGERAFIGPNDEVFRLGIPVEIKMRPVDAIVGWRSNPLDRFVTYGGAGATFLSYEETSDFADPSENVKESYTGFVLLGGVEVRVMRWVHVRGEVRYRSIKDALGVGGVSQEFEETNLGGFGGALKIAVGR